MSNLQINFFSIINTLDTMFVNLSNEACIDYEVKERAVHC